MTKPNDESEVERLCDVCNGGTKKWHKDGQGHIMTFAAGRGTVYACRALPASQRPNYMRLSPFTGPVAFVFRVLQVEGQ